MKRTSREPVQGNTVTGDGCGRRGYKTFLRLLRDFIEASEYGNYIFEDMIELDGDATIFWRTDG